MHHIEYSEREIKLLIENFEILKTAVLSIENKVQSELNYNKNVCGFFLADFSSLEAWYSQKYLDMGGYQLPNFNTGYTEVAFSYPEEIYKNFRDIEITELINKNNFNENQIYMKLSFEKFYIRKALLGKKCAYRAGLVVDKIKIPSKVVDAKYNRFTFAEENENITVVDKIQKGYIVSDNFNNILDDIKTAFLYSLSESTQDKLFLIDEQTSINNLGGY